MTKFYHSRWRQQITWLVLLAFVQLQITSCGGASSGTGGTPAQGGVSVKQSATVNGTVILPSGVNLALSSLQITSTQGQVTVGANGQFKLPIVPSEPVLVAVSSQGKLIMLSFLTAASANAEVSAHTTAVALLYYALGAFTLPPNQQQQALSLLDSDPVVPSFTAALTAGMAADPTVLTDGDQTLSSAMQTAQQAVLARTPSSSPKPQTAASGSLTVTPTTPQSGATLASASDGSVSVTNLFRRQIELLVYQTADTPINSSQSVPLQTAVQVLGSPGVQVGAVSGVSTIIDVIVALITTIGAAVTQGNNPFVASTGTLKSSLFSLLSGDQSTQYTVVMLSPSLKNMTPAVFSNPQFAPFVNGWINDFTNLQFQSFFFDMIMPIIGSIFGGRDIIASLAGQPATSLLQQFLLALTQGGINVVPQLQNLVQTGQWPDAASFFFNVISKDSGVLLAVTAAISKLESTATQQTFATFLLGRLAQASIWLNALQLLLAAQDVGRVLSDLHNSNEAESWQVSVSSNPSPSPTTPGGPTTLNATYSGTYSATAQCSTSGPQTETIPTTVEIIENLNSTNKTLIVQVTFGSPFAVLNCGNLVEGGTQVTGNISSIGISNLNFTLSSGADSEGGTWTMQLQTDASGNNLTATLSSTDGQGISGSITATKQ